jgi:DNA-binding transcriptional MerR regulator
LRDTNGGAAQMKHLDPVEVVRERYGGKSIRTIDRWVEAGLLPKPLYIAGKRFWDREELDRIDEARKSGTGA